MSRLRDQSGAAMVEFALVFPMFLLLVLGMLDFARVFHYWIDGTELSHVGSRFAAVGRNPGPEASLQASIQSRADTNELRDGSASVTAPLKVYVCFPNGPTVGNPVQVRTEFTYKFLGLVGNMVPGVTEKTVKNTSTMRIERIGTITGNC